MILRVVLLGVLLSKDPSRVYTKMLPQATSFNERRVSPSVPGPVVLLREGGSWRVGDLELFTPARRV